MLLFYLLHPIGNKKAKQSAWLYVLLANYYANMVTGFSKNAFNVCKNAAPTAPSTTR
ncbi:MAG: hypothetical protein RIQ61_808 [Bacteroidota bacterium]